MTEQTNDKIYSVKVKEVGMYHDYSFLLPTIELLAEQRKKQKIFTMKQTAIEQAIKKIKVKRIANKCLDVSSFGIDEGVKMSIDILTELQQTETQQRDDFAVAFLDWYGGLRLDEVDGKETQELLEIFKKEYYAKP